MFEIKNTGCPEHMLENIAITTTTTTILCDLTKLGNESKEKQQQMHSLNQQKEKQTNLLLLHQNV